MQTGYNTDVKFEGETYHVQTEDRGLDNPLIDTLVYCGGRILFQEKQSYEDLMPGAEGVELERAVAERLDGQHRDFVRRARHGEFAEAQPTLGGILEAGGSIIDVLERFILTDEEIEPLVLDWQETGDGTLSGTLAVSHSAEQDSYVAGAVVSARFVARNLAPVTVFEGETDSTGRLDIPVPSPPGPASALIISVEKDCCAGRLRVALD